MKKLVILLVILAIITPSVLAIESQPNFSPVDRKSKKTEKESSAKPEGISPSIRKSEEPDFGPYMKDLQRTIKANWNPPKGNESKRVVLLFNVDKSGDISNVRVHKSSGTTSCDRAAILAVNDSSPVMPLPLEYIGKSVDVMFTFDYNVFGSSQNSTPVNNFKKNKIMQIDKNAYTSYGKQVKKVILSNINYEKFPHKKTAEVLLLINKNGTLNNTYITETSGNKTYDELILKTIRDCVFSKFPDSINLENITYIFKVTNSKIGYILIPVQVP